MIKNSPGREFDKTFTVISRVVAGSVLTCEGDI